MNAPFLDSNILVYSVTDDGRAAIAQQLLAEPFVISVQGLNEFANVARRKQDMSWHKIRQAVDAFMLLAKEIVPLTEEVHLRALEIAARLKLSFHDALMLAAAQTAHCRLFLSEDLQDGLKVDGDMRVVNPFP